MIKLGSFCDLQSSASASHTANSPRRLSGEGKSKERKKQLSILQFFFLLQRVWWQPTKELRKSLIIYFARQCGDCLSTIDPQLTAISRDFSRETRRSQTCTHASPGEQQLLLLKLYFFSPKQKKKLFYSHNFHHTPKLDSHFHILFSLLLSLELTMSRCKRFE